MSDERFILVKPEVCLDLWRNIFIYNRVSQVLANNVITQNKDKLEEMLHDANVFIAQCNFEIQKRIKNDTGTNLPYLFIPDEARVVYNVKDARVDHNHFIPAAKTHNAFTFNAISDILFGTPNPRTVMFMMSEACNLNCKYCFEKHVDTSVLTVEDADAFIDLLFTDPTTQNYIQYDNHSIILEFMGGEPLLQVDLISHICDYFIKSCIKYNRLDWLVCHAFNITTNGTLYFNDNVQELIKKYPEINLSISIDGTKDCHDKNRVYHNGSGSFNETIAAVKEEIKNGRINMPKLTFTRETIPYLFDSIEFFAEMGLPAVSISPVLEEVFTKEDGINYYNQLIKIVDYLAESNKPNFVDIFNCALAVEHDKTEAFCGGEGSNGMLTILPDGSFCTCHRMRDNDDADHSVIIGSTKDGLLKTDEHKSNYEYLKTNNIFSKEWPDKCDNCPFRGKCVGCPAANFEKNKTLTGEVNVNGCFINLARFAANIYYQAKVKGCIENAYVKDYKDKFKLLLPDSEVDTLISIEDMYYGR